MTSVYARLGATALRLIKLKGFRTTLRHYPVNGPVAHDRFTDAIGDTGEADYPIDVAVFPLAPSEQLSANTQEAASRRKLIVAGSSCPVSIRPGDLILLVEGTGPWKVDSADPMGPDGQRAIIFNLVISK